MLIFVQYMSNLVRMTNKPTDTIASLLKGLQVLECFDGQTARLTISDVAGQTGFDRATARRCLLTLHHGGYANYDGKFFSLTPRALRLGLGALSAMPLLQPSVGAGAAYCKGKQHWAHGGAGCRAPKCPTHTTCN